MTYEQKAKEIVRSLCEPLENGRPYLETPLRKTMAEVIATALREAGNAKLEEAAFKVKAARIAALFDGADQKRLTERNDIRNRALDSAADIILSLIQND